MVKHTKTPRREHAFGDLYELLAEKFPDCRTDRQAFDVPAFSALLGYSNETVYKALREFQPLKITVALRMLETASENQGAKEMFWEDLLPFILPNYPEFMRDTEEEDLLG